MQFYAALALRVRDILSSTRGFRFLQRSGDRDPRDGPLVNARTQATPNDCLDDILFLWREMDLLDHQAATTNCLSSMIDAPSPLSFSIVKWRATAGSSAASLLASISDVVGSTIT